MSQRVSQLNSGEVEEIAAVRLSRKCKFCGRCHELQKEKYPAYRKTCAKCGKRNHFACQCQSRVVKPGTEMHIADALFRAHPVEENDEAIPFDNIAAVEMTFAHPDEIPKFRDATSLDPQLTALSQIMKRELPMELKLYFDDREHFVEDGMIFKGGKIVVPHLLRREMLSRIHSAHNGANACIRRAKELYFWPNKRRRPHNHVMVNEDNSRTRNGLIYQRTGDVAGSDRSRPSCLNDLETRNIKSHRKSMI